MRSSGDVGQKAVVTAVRFEVLTAVRLRFPPLSIPFFLTCHNKGKPKFFGMLRRVCRRFEGASCRGLDVKQPTRSNLQEDLDFKDKGRLMTCECRCRGETEV